MGGASVLGVLEKRDHAFAMQIKIGLDPKRSFFGRSNNSTDIQTLVFLEHFQQGGKFGA